MQYISLYRKYRPKVFREVIGQNHIVRTLTNQIISNRVGHAYLFTGTRGTGKTTCAKIFARAINCEKPVNGDPCGECDICKGLENTTNMDILEIDAASNNGVDEIRELRDKVKYPPTVGKYKVYIIDEVHMLSTSAFNALLKTLEEPPAHVVFILATTEAHKLPQTILSRCLRFDFRLIQTEVIAKRLRSIFDDIKKPYEEEAVTCIASAGEGSVRDALSIADMCVSYCQKTITYDEVLDVLGVSSPENVLEIAKAIITGDISKALEEISSVTAKGKNVSLLAGDLAKMLRNIIFAKNCTDANKTLAMPSELFVKIKSVADLSDNSKLVYALEVISEVEFRQRFSSEPQIVLEAAVVRAGDKATGLGVDALLLRLRELESKVASGMSATSSEMSMPTKVSEKNAGSAKNVWAYVVTRLKEIKKLSLYSASVQDDNEFTYANGVFYLQVARRADYDFIMEKENYHFIEMLLLQNYDFINRFEVKCTESDEDVDGDVGKIKAMFDSSIVSIKK